MWYRVFGHSESTPDPVGLVEHLVSVGLVVTPHFRGDELGWTSAELFLSRGGSPVMMDRYLTEEDELRHDLNNWAADLETRDYSPNHVQLMEWVIQTRQLITIRKPIDYPDEVALERLCLELSRWLSHQIEGVYQIDNKGWFSESGELRLEEY